MPEPLAAAPGAAVPADYSQAIADRYGAKTCGAGSLGCGSALTLSAIQPGDWLVDLGCGSGVELVSAAEQTGPTGRVFGVDSTPAMVERARRRMREAGFDPEGVLQANLAALPFSDHSLDLVISNCAINHAPDKGAVFSEIFRVLKPDGRFVVSDILARADLPDEVVADPQAWADCYGGAITPERYLAAIRAAGFGAVEVLEESAPYEKSGVTLIKATLRSTKQ